MAWCSCVTKALKFCSGIPLAIFNYFIHFLLWCQIINSRFLGWCGIKILLCWTFELHDDDHFIPFLTFLTLLWVPDHWGFLERRGMKILLCWSSFDAPEPGLLVRLTPESSMRNSSHFFCCNFYSKFLRLPSNCNSDSIFWLLIEQFFFLFDRVCCLWCFVDKTKCFFNKNSCDRPRTLEK